jgi:hypothetical protein
MKENLMEEVKKASEEFKKRREGYKKAKKGIQINLTDLIGDNLTEEEIKERCETLLKWINKDRKDDDEYIDYIWSEFGNDEEWEKRMPPIYEKNKRIEPIEKAINQVNNIANEYLIKEEAERKKQAEQKTKKSAKRRKQVEDLPF